MQPLRFVPSLLLALCLGPSAATSFAQPPDAAGDAPQAGGIPPEAAARLGQLLEREWQERPEWADMAIAILKGNPNDGWWKDTQTRYHWDWLAEKFDQDYSSAVERSEFPELPGADALFARLDRDGDGAVTADDFDWSDSSPYLQQLDSAQGLFSRLDANSDGRLTPQDLAGFVDDADPDDLGFLTTEDLLSALQRPRDLAGGDDMPRPDQMLTMLLDGELGSLNPGPSLDDEAPDFTLPLYDGSAQVTLSDARGKRPVVLVFGSFT